MESVGIKTLSLILKSFSSLISNNVTSAMVNGNKPVDLQKEVRGLGCGFFGEFSREFYS